MKRLVLMLVPVLLSSCVSSGAAYTPLDRVSAVNSVQIPTSGTCPCFKQVYSFDEPTGIFPEGRLTFSNGLFYGTASGAGPDQQGTVFSLTPSGAFTVLHAFASGADGALPLGGLVNLNGTFYGTTWAGGSGGFWGTVYSITPDGTETVIHSFLGGADGAKPRGELLARNGLLYGTTEGGYSSGGDGTVFQITTSGVETILHEFGTGNDGQDPVAGLIDDNGTFYGTTWGGGKYGYGTVFSITPGGTEKVLHSFAGGSDGREPASKLVDLHGVLYGTTWYGGASDHGTVFSITTSGKEAVLYNFSRSTGGVPNAGLLNFHGQLYGVTQFGATYPYTYGTVFSLTAGGTFTILHRFKRPRRGGRLPYANLIEQDGVLYGTTEWGGLNGGGTVFKIWL